MVTEHRNLSRMLEVAVVAARLAGQRAAEELNFLKISEKNSDELVTQADTKCQQIIIEQIKQTYPDHGFIAEEGAEGELFKQPPRGAEPLWWVIDPIDGTNNFAHRVLQFAVSIAVCYEGRPIVGVIFEPATDSMFTTVTGNDAQLNGRRIEASEDSLDNFSSIGLDSFFSKEISLETLKTIMQTKYRNLGSTALHMAYVAKGSFIAAILTAPKLWDIAAGALIAESAGALITDWQGQKVFPVDFSSYTGQPIKCLVANKKVHSQMLKLIKD